MMICSSDSFRHAKSFVVSYFKTFDIFNTFPWQVQLKVGDDVWSLVHLVDYIKN